ncbi:MAG TPA: hypothetical protein VEK11_19230 [Thermoanaerobaculia bacterium]|nr:hypothetical protein [Thermoanaerobaculia bacterium]
MMVKTDDWRTAYHDAIARGRARAGDPPTPEELIAWSRGELPESEAERIRELLALYPDLAAALAEDHDDGDDEAPVLTRAQMAADWELLQARLNEGASPLPAPHRAAQPPALPWQWATAASVLLTVVFAALFVRSRSTVLELREELRRPRENVERVVLLEHTSRGPGGATPVELLPSTEHLLLGLAPDDDVHASRLDATIRDADDPSRRILWRGVVTRGSDGAFSLVIPRSFFAARSYVIELYGDAVTQPIATYTLWISP